VRNKFLLAAITWTVLVAYLCLTNAANIPKVSWLHIQNKDKIVHFTFYFVFTFLWVNTLKQNNNFSPRKARVYIFIAAFIFGVIIEICQGIIGKGRSADIIDVLANTSGSALSILMIWLLEKRKK
jgi:VanZ family protein